jgi:hypothetical protein
VFHGVVVSLLLQARTSQAVVELAVIEQHLGKRQEQLFRLAETRSAGLAATGGVNHRQAAGAPELPGRDALRGAVKERPIFEHAAFVACRRQGNFRIAKHAVIGLAGVDNVAGAGGGHVAVDARPIGRGLVLLLDRERATLVRMAGEAPLAMELDTIGRGLLLVRVMTGNAAKLALASLETGAGSHLLDLADGGRTSLCVNV